VWSEHISLLTDREGRLRFEPFRHLHIGVKWVGEGVWREICN
jgi:hypothetical protein